MSQPSVDELDGSQWCAVDAVCCRFEAAWENDQQPHLSDYLGDIANPVRTVLFRELLLIELDHRRARGEPIRRDDYEHHWSEFAHLIRAVFAEVGLSGNKGKLMKCPQCGSENAAIRDSCAKCGQALTEGTLAGPAVLQCPKCGRVMPVGAKFCGFDRTPLYPSATPVPAASPPPTPKSTPPAERPDVKVAPAAVAKSSAPLPATRMMTEERIEVGASVRDERREATAELLSPHASLREMVLISGGEVMLGSPEGVGNEDEQPQHKVKLSAYYIDRCAVSNVEYERFDPTHKTRRTDVADGDNDPVVMVSHQDALNYCRWRSTQEGVSPDAYTLPSEAQWERAARGGYPDRLYPWGDVIRPELCNSQETGRGRTLPVNQSHPNGFLLFHMGSNIREWCWDYYSRIYYSQKLFPWVDPRGPGPQILDVFRVVRGASFLESAANFGRCAARGFADSRGKQTDIGFRCVRAVTVR
ncbi:MAG: SUMF1/EgtB/PvdO family nonheme iron enzyme [Planctomycetes bacterium]|nr:SUMF1/EgtB/PvdO family nonheme iron enzyme [Planctomycetota bacterium]